MPATFTTRRKEIRVLLLEDNGIDAELILHQLRKVGFEPHWHRVETEREFTARLDADIDVILSDYCLPQFDALAALRCVRQLNLDIPFIIITGSMNEKLAFELKDKGATDYLLKHQLERLAPTISNALEQNRNRAGRDPSKGQHRPAP